MREFTEFPKYGCDREDKVVRFGRVFFWFVFFTRTKKMNMICWLPMNDKQYNE